MSRYIDAEVLKDRIEYHDYTTATDRKPTADEMKHEGLVTFEILMKWVDSCPTAKNIVPIVHARWIVNRDYGDCTCSACRTVYEDNGETIPDYWNYCPHCGAKMDEEE